MLPLFRNRNQCGEREPQLNFQNGGADCYLTRRAALAHNPRNKEYSPMSTSQSQAVASVPGVIRYPSFPRKPISFSLVIAVVLVSTGLATFVALLTLQNLTAEGTAKLKNLQAMLFTVKGLLFRPLYWVIEELVFRGFLLQVLRRKFSLFFAMFASGLLFALEHFGKGVPDMILAFVFSYYFAWLMVRTNSIYAPIVAHGAFDVAAFYVVSPIAVTYGHLADGRYSFPLWWYGAGFVILVVGLLILRPSLMAKDERGKAEC